MPLMKIMKTVTSPNSIEYFKANCAVYGILEGLYTDNVRYFVSNEFHNFTTDWKFMHITSSPRYSQSNGFIEHMVQTIKITFKRVKQSRMGYQMAKPKNNYTDSHLPSPVEILYGRKMRIPTLLNTNNLKDNQIWEWMNNNIKKQQKYFNRNAKYLPELIIGSKISVCQIHGCQWWW